MKNKFSIHTIQILALAFACAGLFSSCKKLIEIPPNPVTSVAASQVFADSADVMSAIAGVYHNFQVVDGQSSILSSLMPECTGLSGDELYNTQSYDAAAAQLFNNAILSDNTYVGSLWQTAYQPIYQVNACLEGVEGSAGLSVPLKQQLTGEMKVVRALYYFNLVNIFGAVPIPLSTNYKTNAALSRTSVDSVYGQIITDLGDALSLLTADYPSAGRARPNIYTAMSLLSKIYLYRKQYELAANLASQVINTGNYSLEQDPDNVFLDGSSETIWALPGNGLYYQTSVATLFVPPYYASSPTFALTNSLMTAFEPNDRRQADWVGSMAGDLNGAPITYYYPFKYKNTDAASPTQEDFTIFRLGELYLIRAEALANQGKTDSAKADLNQVRLRAGLNPTTAMTQADLLNAIMHERQIELFCEGGNRWFDLKRTETIDGVLGMEKTGWQPYDALYPIPLSDIRLDPYLTQNPNYN